VDTAQAYLIKQANTIIRKDMEELLVVLKQQAVKYKHTPCIGRTHGIHADVTTFGLK
jgi:adenylosuccinate lyase